MKPNKQNLRPFFRLSRNTLSQVLKLGSERAYCFQGTCGVSEGPKF